MTATIGDGREGLRCSSKVKVLEHIPHGKPKNIWATVVGISLEVIGLAGAGTDKSPVSLCVLALVRFFLLFLARKY